MIGQASVLPKSISVVEKQENFLKDKSPLRYSKEWVKKDKHAHVPIKFDQKCFNCSSDHQQITKLFKLACLQYQPGDVNYRGNVFTKDKMMTLRKFLLGQASIMINSSERMSNMSLTPRRVFDDIFLYMQNVSKKDVMGKNAFDIDKIAENQMSMLTFLHDDRAITRKIGT